MAISPSTNRRLPELVTLSGKGGIFFGPLLMSVEPLLTALDSTYVLPTITAGFALTTAGTVAFVMGKIWLTLPRRAYSYVIRPLRETEIGSLDKVLEKFAEGGVVPASHKLDIIRRNRRQFFVVERARHDAGNGTVGYFFFYALKKKASIDIQEGHRIGAHVRAEDIAKSNRRATTFYVGFLYGSDRISRAAVIDGLRNEIQNAAARRTGVKIFGRPMSAAAVNLAKRHNFTQLDGKSPPKLRRVVCKIIS